MATLPKNYRPDEHEPRMVEAWSDPTLTGADPRPVLDGKAEPYCILMPPPNVTDRLHLGHALNNTLQDVLIRAHRMMGDESLWMPGTDHAGISTQTKVEKQLIERDGKRRTDFERDEFVAIVQEWKDEYEATITHQLQRMGCSADWRRRRFTMDNVCARAVRASFFSLFGDDLVYRGKRLVNWDPVTRTALADDEVEMKDVEGRFYYLRYPLTHADGVATGQPVTWSELHARGYPVEKGVDDDDQAWVTVATTRPETYLGDTAVAVNPDDPRAGALDGLAVQLPLVGRIIPIVKDDYVVLADPDSDDPKARLATGFLKVTPAHDPNDWEIGRRHNLPVINVMAEDATISDSHGWEDVGDAHLFVGLSREAAREKVVHEFEARGLLERTRPHSHSVGHSYRSHAAIEPYLSDQWYVKVTDDRLRGSALRAMDPEQRTSSEFRAEKSNEFDGGLRFHPPRYARTFEIWHENLRDWCISRQLWWGHRIPVWWAPEGAGDDLPDGVSADDARFTMRRFDDRLCVCIRGDAEAELEAAFEKAGWIQDPDVLDTWFSSALWPLNTMGWPDPTDETEGLLEAFNPTSALFTAREIITLWVSRMVMFNRYFLSRDGGKTPGRLPFRDVFIHAMIQDGEGRKMSKSLGNGVDPLDIIHSHGSDAMRFVLCQMTTQTQDVRMPVEKNPETGRNTSPKFDIGRNFCTKLWNAVRFALMTLEEADSDPDHTVDFTQLTVTDRWMLSRLATTIDGVNDALSRFEFSSYAQAMYDLLWRDLCDWYLEAIKPTVRENRSQQAILRTALDAIVRLLHPICPFITEAIYESLKDVRCGRVRTLELTDGPMLCRASWPEADDDLRNADAETRFGALRAITESIRAERSRQNVAPRQKVVLHVDDAMKKRIAGGAGLVETMAGLEEVTTEPAPESGQVATFTHEGREYTLSGLSEGVDADVERAALDAKIDKLGKEIKVLEGRLNNPGYVEKAPAHMVEETRMQLSQKQAERDAAERRIGELA